MKRQERRETDHLVFFLCVYGLANLSDGELICSAEES